MELTRYRVNEARSVIHDRVNTRCIGLMHDGVNAMSRVHT